MALNNTSVFPPSIGEPQSSQDTLMRVIPTLTHERHITTTVQAKKRKLNNMCERPWIDHGDEVERGAVETKSIRSLVDKQTLKVRQAARVAQCIAQTQQELIAPTLVTTDRVHPSDLRDQDELLKEKETTISSQAQIIQSLKSELEQAHRKASAAAMEMTAKVTRAELNARQLSLTLQEQQQQLDSCFALMTPKSHQIDEPTTAIEVLVHRMHGLSVEHGEKSSKAKDELELQQANETIGVLNGEAIIRDDLLSRQRNTIEACNQKFKDLEGIHEAKLENEQDLIREMASLRIALKEKDKRIDGLNLSIASQEERLSIEVLKAALRDRTIEELRGSNTDAVNEIIGIKSKVSSLQADLDDRTITIARESEAAAAKLYQAQLNQEALENANTKLTAESASLMEGLKDGRVFMAKYDGEDVMTTVQRLSYATILLTTRRADGERMVWHGGVERCTLECYSWNWCLCWAAEDMETVHQLYISIHDLPVLQAWLEAAKMKRPAPDDKGRESPLDDMPRRGNAKETRTSSG